MSRASTPKNGSRNNPEPPPGAFDPDKFLRSHGLDKNICEMFQVLLHVRPTDPLLFVHDYLKALARAEDERFQEAQLISSAMSSPRVGGKKKKDKDLAPTMALTKVKKRQAGRENVSDVDSMKLRLELERFSAEDDSGMGGQKSDRLHELLSGVFLSMVKAGGNTEGGIAENVNSSSKDFSPRHVNTVPLAEGSALLRSLGEEMKLPRRALDHLMEELAVEAKGEKITFGQFCGVGRSLAMLPRFLEEAERLCSKLNGRPSPMKHQLTFEEDLGNSGRISPQSAIMDAVVDTESLLGALPIGTGDRAEEGVGIGMAWLEDNDKNEDEVARAGGQVSLRDSLLAILGETQSVQVGVFDLVSATLNSKR